MFDQIKAEYRTRVEPFIVIPAAGHGLIPTYEAFFVWLLNEASWQHCQTAAKAVQANDIHWRATDPVTRLELY